MKTTTTFKAAREDSVEEAIIEESDSSVETGDGVRLPSQLGVGLHETPTSTNVSEHFDPTRWFILHCNSKNDRPKLKVGIKSA